MSIDISTVTDYPGIRITITKESLKAFKELVNRSMNCWDNAPAELKIFADKLIHGGALQDYASQEDKPKKPAPITQNLAVQFGLKDVCSECGGLGKLHIHSSLVTPCSKDPRYKNS